MNRRLLMAVATLLFGTVYNSSCRADWDVDLDDNGVLSIVGDDSYYQEFVIYIDGDELVVAAQEAETAFDVVDLGGTYLEWESDDFDLDEIVGIVFDGLGGEDVVVNQTNIPSFMYGGDGNDRLLGGFADDFIDGGPGDDGLLGGPNFTNQPGMTSYGNGPNPFTGEDTDGNDILIGGDGDDALVGGKGKDQLLGEAGADFLDGGPGSDFLDFGTDGEELGANVTLGQIGVADTVVRNYYVAWKDGRFANVPLDPKFLLAQAGGYHNLDWSCVKTQWRRVPAPMSRTTIGTLEPLFP